MNLNQYEQDISWFAQVYQADIVNTGTIAAKLADIS